MPEKRPYGLLMSRTHSTPGDCQKELLQLVLALPAPLDVVGGFCSPKCRASCLAEGL